MTPIITDHPAWCRRTDCHDRHLGEPIAWRSLADHDVELSLLRYEDDDGRTGLLLRRHLRAFEGPDEEVEFVEGDFVRLFDAYCRLLLPGQRVTS